MEIIVFNIILAFTISLLQFFYIKSNKLINSPFVAHGYIFIIFIIFTSMLFIGTIPLFKILFLVILWLLTEYKPLIYIFNIDKSARFFLVVFSTLTILINALI